jgi:hypothetical protein
MWMPVFRKDHAPTKILDPDPIQLNWIGSNAADYITVTAGNQQAGRAELPNLDVQPGWASPFTCTEGSVVGGTGEAVWTGLISMFCR